jgi:putative ABC transport system substrate-binding protein
MRKAAWIAAMLLVGVGSSCCRDVAAPPVARVGVVWSQQSGMADRVWQGFADQMKKKAPGVAIDVHGSLKDEAAAASVYEEFQSTKDAVVFLRSAGAQYMAKHPPRVPCFFGAADSPVALGVLQNMNVPEGNITGVTYYVPVEQRFSVLIKLLPNVKSAGLLVMKGHPSSGLDQDETKAACQKRNIQYHEALCADPAELKAAVEAMRDKVDMFILGTQNLLIDNSGVVASNSGGKPVISYTEEPILAGNAVCGLVPSDEKLGRMLADSVMEVLLKGKKVAEVPVKTDPEPKLVICVTRLKQHGMTVPEDLMKNAILVK